MREASTRQVYTVGPLRTAKRGSGTQHTNTQTHKLKLKLKHKHKHTHKHARTHVYVYVYKNRSLYVIWKLLISVEFPLHSQYKSNGVNYTFATKKRRKFLAFALQIRNYLIRFGVLDGSKVCDMSILNKIYSNIYVFFTFCVPNLYQDRRQKLKELKGILRIYWFSVMRSVDTFTEVCRTYHRTDYGSM